MPPTLQFSRSLISPGTLEILWNVCTPFTHSRLKRAYPITESAIQRVKLTKPLEQQYVDQHLCDVHHVQLKSKATFQGEPLEI